MRKCLKKETPCLCSQGVLQCCLVPECPQTCDHTLGGVRQIRVVAKFLSFVDIRQMHFYKRNGNSRERIPYRDTGVRICSCIDDDVLGAIAPGFLNSVDQRAFVIALKDGQRGTPFSRHLFETLIDVGQGKPAVDLGLACSEQVEIGAVQNQNALRHYGNFVKTERLFTLKRSVCPLNAMESARSELGQIGVQIVGIDLPEDVPKLVGVCAENDGVRQAAMSVAQLLHYLDAAVPRHQQRIGHLNLLQEAVDIGAGIYGYAHEIHFLVFLRKRVEIGHFLDTRRTPGGPEVHDKRPARIRGKGHIVAVKVGVRTCQEGAHRVCLSHGGHRQCANSGSSCYQRCLAQKISPIHDGLP